MSSSSSSISVSKKYFNCLLATHNNILQCTIDKLMPRQDGIKIRFKNCAILCLTIDLDTAKIVEETGIKDLKVYKFKLELVYDGLLSVDEDSKRSDDKPYYVKDYNVGFTDNIGNRFFNPITDFIGEDRILNLLPKDLNALKNKLGIDAIRFYIVRHGQAEHNEKKFNPAGMGLKLDTSVTTEGQVQAAQAAQALGAILTKSGPNEHISLVFASDLQRTRQTLLPFFQKPYVMPLDTIIIDPCANELASNGDGTGNCWEKTASTLLQARENYPACNPETCPTIKSLSGENINIDWRLYTLFYKYSKNGVRGYPTAKDRPNCADTNMVAMAVFYLLNLYNPSSSIDEPEYDIEEGGHIMLGGSKSRSKNKNRKHKKKTIRRVRGKRRSKSYKK